MKLLSQEQIRDYSDKRVMLPLSGGINSIYDIKENGKRVFTHNNCLAEVDPSYDVWECGDTYATVGSPKGFLYTMNRHVITRQFGSSSPMLRERLYKVANCDPNAKLSQHEITVSCKS